MTSWRDSLSKTVAGEMDELLDASPKAAKERLDADDVLLPFVQVVEDDGSQGTRMVEIVEDVRPDQLLEELFEKLRAERDRAIAERDALRAERLTLAGERDALREERDLWRARTEALAQPLFQSQRR